MALLPVPPQQFMPVEKPTPFAQMRRKRRAERNFTDWSVEQDDFASYAQMPTTLIFRTARNIRVNLEMNGETSQALSAHSPALQKSQVELEQTFHALAETWRNETGRLSSTLHKVTHPAYQRIIGLGPQALPLILQELKDRPNFWFWALRAISGEDPTQTGDSIEAATASWVNWGVERGLLSGA